MRRVAKRTHREEVRDIIQGAVKEVGLDATEMQLAKALWAALPRSKLYVKGWCAEWREQKNAILLKHRQRHARVQVQLYNSGPKGERFWMGVTCVWCSLGRIKTRGCMLCAPKRDCLETFIASPFWVDLRQKLIEGMPKPIAADMLDDRGEWEIAALLRKE